MQKFLYIIPEQTKERNNCNMFALARNVCARTHALSMIKSNTKERGCISQYNVAWHHHAACISKSIFSHSTDSMATCDFEHKHCVCVLYYIFYAHRGEWESRAAMLIMMMRQRGFVVVQVAVFLSGRHWQREMRCRLARPTARMCSNQNSSTPRALLPRGKTQRVIERNLCCL